MYRDRGRKAGQQEKAKHRDKSLLVPNIQLCIMETTY